MILLMEFLILVNLHLYVKIKIILCLIKNIKKVLNIWEYLCLVKSQNKKDIYGIFIKMLLIVLLYQIMNLIKKFNLCKMNHI